MDAIEFVKKYGKAVAVNLHNKSQGCKLSEVLFYDSKNDKYECVDSEDLKQIIEAFELVESFEGLFQARVALYKEGFTGGIECGDRLIEDDVLKQAIELVEKCNES